MTTVPTVRPTDADLPTEPARPTGYPRELIAAKIHVPVAGRPTVRRTRVLRMLRAARERRVVSLLAPAGYGKTRLLAQWVAAESRSAAWLTVDDHDNDPAVFLTGLAAAIAEVAPVDPAIFAAIASPAVSGRTVVGRLLAAIAERSRPVILVIDEAPRLIDQACLDALAELVWYLPAGSQVAIAGREPTGFPIARWNADGAVLEIGPADLAMDREETIELARLLDVTLAPQAAERLVRQTTGWPALLALSVAEARRTGREIHVDAGRDRVIVDYLRSELLTGRADADVAFLTRTSILEHLSGRVCDHLADGAGSNEVLERLARSTLLVDEYGGSYRYHALLREFLQAELEAREPGQVTRLHRRAAAWYDANDATDLAVDHAFAAQDVDLAADLVGRAMFRYHWSGRRSTTRGWLRRLGDGALQERPWLAILAAWEELSFGDLAATVRFADIAEQGSFDGRPPDGTASLESGRAMLKAAMARSGGRDALADAALAAELEPSGSPWRALALWELAIARRMTGDPSTADALLEEAIESTRNDNGGLRFCLLGHRALLAVDRGDWEAATAFVAEAEGIPAHESLAGYLSSAPGLAARARIAVRHGDIAAARRVLAEAASTRSVMSAACPILALESLVGFARGHLAVGDPAGAAALLSQARGVIRVRPDLGVLPAEVGEMAMTIGRAAPSLGASAFTLTVAELRVLGLLPYYLSFKEIGQRLGVKATTVKTHALSVYGKLGASTRSEAVDLAVLAGLLEPFAPRPPVSAIAEDALDPAR